MSYGEVNCGGAAKPQKAEEGLSSSEGGCEEHISERERERNRK